MAKEKEVNFLGNYVEMTGRVSFIEVKYTQNGKPYTRVLISKKGSAEGDYSSFAFTFFDKEAEDFAEKIQKGDYANVTGYMTLNKYEKDGKKIERIELVGRHFVKAEYDENAKGYVMAKGKNVPWA